MGEFLSYFSASIMGPPTLPDELDELDDEELEEDDELEDELVLPELDDDELELLVLEELLELELLEEVVLPPHAESAIAIRAATQLLLQIVAVLWRVKNDILTNPHAWQAFNNLA